MRITSAYREVAQEAFEFAFFDCYFAVAVVVVVDDDDDDDDVPMFAVDVDAAFEVVVVAAAAAFAVFVTFDVGFDIDFVRQLEDVKFAVEIG